MSVDENIEEKEEQKIEPLEVKVINQVEEKKEEAYRGEESVEYYPDLKITDEEKEDEELEW